MYNTNAVITNDDIFLVQKAHFRVVKKLELQRKVGQRIIELRAIKGWSQADLARACNKDRQSIERIENGKVAPSLYSLYEISKALEVSLAKLLSI